MSQPDPAPAAPAERLRRAARYWTREQFRLEVRSLLSLLVFLVVMAFLFQSWPLALVWASALGVHELGHIFVVSLLGIDWTMGFGLLGAWTQTPEAERAALTQFQNALIHLAGPLFSLGYALLAVLIHLVWQPASSHLLQLASFSAQIALLNLLPMGRLSDGGKAIRRVLDSFDERGDWEIVAAPILLLVYLLVGFTIAGVLLPDMSALTVVAALGVAAVMFVLWAAVSELAGASVARRVAISTATVRALFGVVTAEVALLALGLSGYRIVLHWQVIWPYLLGVVLPVAWLAIAVLLSRGRDIDDAFPAPVMTRRQGIFVVALLSAALIAGVIVTLTVPFWLTRGAVLAAAERHAQWIVRVWFWLRGGVG